MGESSVLFELVCCESEFRLLTPALFEVYPILRIGIEEAVAFNGYTDQLLRANNC